MKKNNIIYSLLIVGILFLNACSAQTDTGQNNQEEQTGTADITEAENPPVLQEDTEETEKTEETGSSGEEETGMEETSIENSEKTPSAPEGDKPYRIYQTYYEESPDSAYSADEWFKEDGSLDYPFPLDEDTSTMQASEMFARFYIPKEALERASTADLLRVSKIWPMTRFSLYNFPSYYLEFETNHFNAVDELLSRSDLAETLLQAYLEDEFLPNASFSSKKEQENYKKKGYNKENEIVFEEILLARNETFDQMTEEMKQQTLEAVREKMEQRHSGEYICDFEACGFYAYISELHDYTSESKWYDYLVQTYPDDELITYLDGYWLSGNWP